MSKTIPAIIGGAALLAGLLWVFIPRTVHEPLVEPDTGSAEELATLNFSPFLLPADELEAKWEEERAELAPPAEDSLELIAATRRINFAQGLLAQQLFEGDLDELQEAYHAERRSWAEFRTGEDFLALGWAAHESFEESLREILRLASTTESPLRHLLRNPMDPTVHAYYEAGGDFLDHAITFGLVGLNGEVLVQPEFFTLLFRRMWISRMADHWAPDTLLPGIESREFLRWQIEQGQVSLAVRLRLIDQYETEHGFTQYPMAFARAVAHHQDGDIDTARAVLQEAVAGGTSHPLIVGALERLSETERSTTP